MGRSQPRRRPAGPDAHAGAETATCRAGTATRRNDDRLPGGSLFGIGWRGPLLDEQGIGDERDFFPLARRAFDRGAWLEIRQARNEPRVVWMKVFEDDSFVLSDLGDLLIGRSGLKKRRIEAFGEQAFCPPGQREGASQSTKPLHTALPICRDRTEADGDKSIRAFGDEKPRGLQVGDGDDSVRIGRGVEAHADGVVRIEPARCAFPAKA